MYIPFPRTIFRSVRKIPPGHWMTVSFETAAGRSSLGIEQRPYWDLRYSPDASLSEQDWVEGLREKINEAVRVRLMSDVPLGAFLSGGVDSSAVVAAMAAAQAGPVKTFSVGFEEEDFSEIEYARAVARRFGTDHHEEIVRPDAVGASSEAGVGVRRAVRGFLGDSDLPRLPDGAPARDRGPFGRRRGRDIRRVQALRLGRRPLAVGLPSQFRPPGRFRLALRPHAARDAREGALRNMSMGPYERYRSLITHDEPGYLDRLLTADVKVQMRADGDDLFKQFYGRFPDADYLTRLQYLDTKTYLAEDILTKVDRTSMLCSLETRAPLLDHELQEYVARMPASLKLFAGEKKYIFRRAMRGVLPDEILDRPKMGFCGPAREVVQEGP